MGNNQSSDGRRSAPQSPHSLSHASSSSSAKHSHDLYPTTSRTHREPRRRESIQATLGLGAGAEKAGKGQPVAPTASTPTVEPFKSSSSHSSAVRVTSNSNRSSPQDGITRPTTSSSGSSRAQQSASRSEAPIPEPRDSDKMGNEQSRPTTATARDSARAQLPSLSRQSTREAPSPIQIQTQQQTPQQTPQQHPPVGPVDVPSGGGHAHHGSTSSDTPLSPLSPGQSASYSMPVSAGFSRPPRLPLPIEEEEYVPGSPVLSPADLHETVVETLGGEGSPRRTRSILSSTTVDDEVDDMSEEVGLVGEAQGPSVPTEIEWRGVGERVYVTGTFAAWDRKYRLHKDGPSKHANALSVTLNLQPGTHHLKFIVDGDMRLSDHLPTAVDYTNILVNYIEVSADDRPAQPTSAVQAPGAPVIPPGVEPSAAKPPTVPIMVPSSAPAHVGKLTAHDRPSQPLTPVPERPSEGTAHQQAPAKTPTTETTEKPPTKTPSGRTEHRSERMATKYYHNVVPQFLLDGDQPEDTLAHRNSDNVCDTLPTPPTLPLFLSKSVLNGAMPMKDDASVLMMPNHTVLNHLATSSIRGGTLATSATTRYKQKFLTTIIYKPTADYGD